MIKEVTGKVQDQQSDFFLLQDLRRRNTHSGRCRRGKWWGLAGELKRLIRADQRFGRKVDEAEQLTSLDRGHNHYQRPVWISVLVTSCQAL